VTKEPHAVVKFVHQRDEYRGLDFLIAHPLDVTLIPMHRCQ
jgi:hypothetical protein